MEYSGENKISLGEKLIRLLYPPKCIFCSCLLDIAAGVEICKSCYKKITFMPEERNKTLKVFDYECSWDCVVCACEYKGIIKEAVMRFKFFDKPSYCRAIGSLVTEKLRNILLYDSYDMIMSVPLHNKKKALRGYNQSLLVSRVISRITGIPERSELIIRIKNTKSQSTLTRENRYFNTRNAFEITDKDEVRDKNILIFDDILTTGYTLNECSRVLKEAGAKKVAAVVIASPVSKGS